MTPNRFAIRSALLGVLLSPLAGQAAILDFLDNGSAADITDTVNGYRSALGALNPNNGSHFSSGRREINWDAVPDTFSDPNPFPGDFFNQSAPGGRARGALFSTPGSGFLLSADDNPGTTPPVFGFGGSDFAPFSQQRIFTPTGSLITTVDFFIPGQPGVAGTTRGFGAIFIDAETAASKIDYYGVGGDLLHSVLVPLNATSGTFSFAGALFDDAVVSRVVITAGDAFLIANGQYGAGADGVVMDDFIYGEPVPEPSTWAMLAAGLAGLGLSLRRRR